MARKSARKRRRFRDGFAVWTSYLSDGLGSTIGLTDGTGALAASYAYDSFGRLATTSTLVNHLTFTGHQHDDKSGFYYARTRYYDPGTGRFLSEDPIHSVNPYPYVANDPTDLIDPSGRQALPERGLITAEQLPLLVETPEGFAVQSATAEAQAVRAAVQNGATLWRYGQLGTSAGPEAQYWSTVNPLITPNYATILKLTTPGPYNWVVTAVVTPGAAFVTREVGGAVGAVIEVVVESFGVTLRGSFMP